MKSDVTIVQKVFIVVKKCKIAHLLLDHPAYQDQYDKEASFSGILIIT